MGKFNFEIKRKIVLAGGSRIFTDWQRHSNITQEDFLSALEWVCNDPTDENGRLTREIGLTPDGIVKLVRVHDRHSGCSFYRMDTNMLWAGAEFPLINMTDDERRMFGDDAYNTYKISLSAMDRV